MTLYREKQYKQKLRILNKPSQHPCMNQCTPPPVIEDK